MVSSRIKYQEYNKQWEQNADKTTRLTLYTNLKISLRMQMPSQQRRLYLLWNIVLFFMKTWKKTTESENVMESLNEGIIWYDHYIAEINDYGMYFHNILTKCWLWLFYFYFHLFIYSFFCTEGYVEKSDSRNMTA